MLPLQNPIHKHINTIVKLASLYQYKLFHAKA